MDYFPDVPPTDANSAHMDENRPLNMGLLGKAAVSFFCQEKTSVELQRCNLLCFTILYLKYSRNVVNPLKKKKRKIAAGQYVPLKTCECFLLRF